MKQYNWCYICKGMIETKEEIRTEPSIRFVWLCIHCNTILAIKGVVDKEELLKLKTKLEEDKNE